MDFYLIEKSYPRTREIANFGKFDLLFPPKKKLGLHPCSRSSNLAKGWHNGFKSIVNCTNPTILNFMDALKLEQSLKELQIVKHLTRTPPPLRQKKWINYDNRLQRVVGSYGSYLILT